MLHKYISLDHLGPHFLFLLAHSYPLFLIGAKAFPARLQYASTHTSDFIEVLSRPSVSVSSWQFTLFHRVIAGESLPRLASGRVVAARESPALIWTPHSRAFCREEGSLHHFTAGTRTPALAAVNEPSESFTVSGERPTMKSFLECLEFLSNVVSRNCDNSRTFVDSYTAARAGQASCISVAESFR